MNYDYVNTYSSIIYIKSDDIYKYIAEGVETRFDTSNSDHCLKEKKAIGLMKDALGGKSMVKFLGLRAKMYS